MSGNTSSPGPSRRSRRGCTARTGTRRRTSRPPATGRVRDRLSTNRLLDGRSTLEGPAAPSPMASVRVEPHHVKDGVRGLGASGVSMAAQRSAWLIRTVAGCTRARAPGSSSQPWVAAWSAAPAGSTSRRWSSDGALRAVEGGSRRGRARGGRDAGRRPAPAEVSPGTSLDTRSSSSPATSASSPRGSGTPWRGGSRGTCSSAGCPRRLAARTSSR